ncbi:hypothetical protein PanWU01x14_150530, partial [Parasponia andersonii]
PFPATERPVIDVYKREVTMRVEDQVIYLNVFKEVDSPSDIDDYNEVDLVKENLEDNELKKAPFICCETLIIHHVGEETLRFQGLPRL